MNLAMYILVNSDIKIGKGKLAGQVGHAVCSYMYHNFMNEDKISKMDELYGESLLEFETYMSEAQKKIILQCPQSKLEELEQQGYITIRDKGLTQLEPNTLTCVNMGLFNRDEYVPEWIKELKLYSK